MLAHRPPDRLDRRVRRSHVRLGAGESQFRVKFALEEALRLAELPGENEGRVYYFRRLSLDSIPARANRRIWMTSVQQALTVSARAAVHGCDPRAHAANGVYFDSEEQLLESQLRHALRPGYSPPWFAAAAFDALSEGGEVQCLVLRIVERLRRTMPRKEAACLILAALGDAGPVALLARLPIAEVRAWLGELHIGRDSPPGVPTIHLPLHLRRHLEQAAANFGHSDLRTAWLATLIVRSLAPATATTESIASRTRSVLQHCETVRAEAPSQRMAATAQLDTDPVEPAFVAGDAPDGAPVEARGTPAAARIAVVEAADPMSPSAARRSVRPAAFTPLLGAPTAAAGLYFLLQALRQLGVKDLLASSAELAATAFVPQILRRLAVHAGVAAEDPILWCLDVAEAELPAAPAATVRLWAVRVRRWCWREGRITVRDVIRRPGQVWLTRTDLDVTLPMDQADVRIRRVGLDIDPGWLPWFGKIVRFHYRDRDPA